jgi:glycosyltransferase involved in cell wall biosynthesis
LNRLDRTADEEAVRRLSPLVVTTWTAGSGFVAALRAGLHAARGEAVAFTDDDAVVPPTWISALVDHLSTDAAVGGVGGPILNIVDGRPTARTFTGSKVTSVNVLGRVQSRLHDTPAHPLVVDVDFLSGGNMCFRRSAIPSIDPLLDAGMAPGNEIAIGQAAQERGWRLRYDSNIVVSHYPAPRDESVSGRADRISYVRDMTYVMTFTMLQRWSGWRRVVFLMATLSIGTRRAPGLLLIPFSVSSLSGLRVWGASMQGKISGLGAARIAWRRRAD